MDTLLIFLEANFDVFVVDTMIMLTHKEMDAEWFIVAYLKSLSGTRS